MHAKRLIQRFLVEGLSEQEQLQLRAHLRQCTICRQEYDKAMTVIRAAAGRTPTRQETTFMRELILTQLERNNDAAAPVPRTLYALTPWLTATAAVTLVFVLSIALTRLKPEMEEPTVQYRGGSAKSPSIVQLEVYGIHPVGGSFSTPRQIADGQTIDLSEYVQFRYQSSINQLRYLYILGIDSNLRLLDYFPRPSRPQSIPISPSTGFKAVPHSIHLEKRHREGSLWIYAFFSQRPLQRDEVHRQLALLRKEGLKLSGKISLGTDVVTVVRYFQLVD